MTKPDLRQEMHRFSYKGRKLERKEKLNITMPEQALFIVLISTGSAVGQFPSSVFLLTHSLTVFNARSRIKRKEKANEG